MFLLYLQHLSLWHLNARSNEPEPSDSDYKHVSSELEQNDLYDRSHKQHVDHLEAQHRLQSLYYLERRLLW
ncbi:hypothetical protein [Myxacorys almedinensis]|uniref:Uncharacterized protein n=1 Tax=Myxacorys almedinensis A TaxID=2690445 RepID=A0A8J8CIX3_9CYAN|nr:hypothetical protein [Myxacorys almedinensis]NDJ18393.1 hypothetical protein [Myxacorys almedinensis A]